MNFKNPLFLIILSTATFFGCSLSEFTVSLTEDILVNGVDATFEEGDLEVAEQSLPANLKLLEGFHRTAPNNKKISLLLIEGYTGYSLGFVEDVDAERAKALYKKARDLGLAILKKNNSFREHFDDNLTTFKNGLSEFTKEDVPIIFWTANAWGNLINLSLNEPEVLKDLYKVNALMDFVLQNDENYFFGGAHIYFGTILATQPRVLGGNPEKAKAHFEKAIKLGNRKFLLPLFYYAKSYAVQTQNKELFQLLLNEVINSPDDILKEQKLINLITKEKSKRLLSKIDDLFF